MAIIDIRIEESIIKNLPDFESNKGIPAGELFDKVTTDFPNLSNDEFDYVLSKMVAEGKIRRVPTSINEEAKYCKLPLGGLVQMPPNQH